MRRFRWHGWGAFLAAVTAVGALRYYLVAAQAFGVIEFAPGLATVFVDALCWAGLTALAQGGRD